MTFPRAIRVARVPLLLASAVALAYGAWSAVVDSAGPNRLIVPVMVDHTARVELFYDTGSGFRAEDSANEIIPAIEQLQDVSFPVPRVPLHAIRFDPMDGAGRFTVGQPRLETASGRFIAKFPMTALVPANQIAEFKVDGKHWIASTTQNANDPQMTFQLGGPLKVGAPRLPWIEGLVMLAMMYLVWRFQEPKPTEPAKESQA